VVKHHDQPVVARLAARLRRADGGVAVGARVVYDPLRRVVHQRIEGTSDGSELLTPLEVLDTVSRDLVGAIHPVVDEIRFLLMRNVQHPEWVARMNARNVQSYLFCGPTGTGKSLTLKLLAKEGADLAESLTGERMSRLVMVDASTFYASLFGETEARIVSYFDRLRTLGKKGLRDKQGRPVPVPLLVVLEEAEALLRGRGEIGGSAHLFDRPLALILQKLSSVAGELGVPTIFATTSNRPDLLDPAAQRRLGIRTVLFGTLTAGQTTSVLEKKIPPGLPLHNAEDYASAEDARRAAINRIVAYLHGDEPEQGIAEVRMQDGQRRIVCRRELVTGAQLEEAVSKATDDCLRQSAQVGHLMGLDADAVIRSLESQYAGLASLMRPHNLPEYCPHWFAGEPLRVESVRPLRHARRPRATLMV
jgi:SpoVK/Ycf46/Vps4 family AAA+-type ATPase